ncbi:MAG: agmatinase [Candidatus Eremiobacteraeota bacterium]|nr:agmatinase [Candidatus Eremiobacteraeota bacterium]
MNVCILGIPHDANSSHMRGAAEAPPLIRKELFSDAYSPWTESGIQLTRDRLIERGDIAFGEGDDWDTIEAHVSAAIDDGSPLISLGGDHAIAHPILRAMHRRYPNITIVHVDAHADIYDAYQGNRRSHASPFARIMEEELASRLIQIGLRTINDHHRDQFARFGVEAIEARHWHDGYPLELSGPVYISVDMDGLDPAFAPGVSHREPGGLSTRTVINLIQSIDQPIVGADVVEYNPLCDLGNLTATVAAKLVKELAGMMIVNAEATSLTFRLP